MVTAVQARDLRRYAGKHVETKHDLMRSNGRCRRQISVCTLSGSIRSKVTLRRKREKRARAGD